MQGPWFSGDDLHILRISNRVIGKLNREYRFGGGCRHGWQKEANKRYEEVTYAKDQGMKFGDNPEFTLEFWPLLRFNKLKRVWLFVVPILDPIEKQSKYTHTIYKFKVGKIDTGTIWRSSSKSHYIFRGTISSGNLNEMRKILFSTMFLEFTKLLDNFWFLFYKLKSEELGTLRIRITKWCKFHSKWAWNLVRKYIMHKIDSFFFFFSSN